MSATSGFDQLRVWHGRAARVIEKQQNGNLLFRTGTMRSLSQTAITFIIGRIIAKTKRAEISGLFILSKLQNRLWFGALVISNIVRVAFLRPRC